MTPVASGKNSTLAFVFGDSSLDIFVEDWEVQQLATEFEDDECGADRTEYGTQVDGYQLNISAKLRDLKPLNAFLAHTAQQDANVGGTDIGVGLRISPNDGTRTTYNGRRIALAPWSAKGSRKTRLTYNFALKMSYFEEL